MMIKPYVLDDGIVEIPEEIRNMSEEEIKREIAILEEAGRREAEHLPELKPLLGIQIWKDSVNKNMSSEEREKLIAILEKQATEEAKNIPEPSLSQI